ncbi:MAG: hypothetical protein ACLU33_05710 [Christensenellales bacterium]
MKKQEKAKVRKTKPLIILAYVIVILLISLVSFGGIYVKDKNKMTNVLRDYILGTDLGASRNIVIKVDEENKELLTEENYAKARDIVVSRLKYMKLDYYEMKFDESTGTIYMDVPENSRADYAAQYSVTKGEFKIEDNDTGELLLSKADVKEAKVQYQTTESGTTVVLNIEFNKDGAEKLRNISNTYVKSTDSEGNDTTKKIKMSLDDTTIMTTYFAQEMTDGQMQVSLGTSSDSEQIQNRITQATNIAVFLNTDTMPLTYKIDVNKSVYSSLTDNVLKIAIIVSIVIFALLLIYMIIKYKKEALLAVVTNIGFVAILILIIRYTNVDITLTGLITIPISVIIQYVFLMNILKVKTEKIDNDSKIKRVKETIRSGIEKLIPVAVIAVVFALTKWETVYSAGMLLFWEIAVLILYNLSTLKIMFLKNEQSK